MTHPIARYVPLLIEGDLRGILGLFSNSPRVNDPALGWVEVALFAQFVADSRDGLRLRKARVAHVATTASDTRAVEECVVTLQRHGVTVDLPVALAGDVAPDALLESIRIYHSMWPLITAHRLRRPVLGGRPGLLLPDVVDRYHDCLARGDVAGILEQFEPEGELREAGRVEVHRGTDSLRRFFSSLFANGGGIGIERCALTDDGASCALEYNVTSWGRRPLVPQAGAAVYDRADTGLLDGVRIYDDVAPPPVLQ